MDDNDDDDLFASLGGALMKNLLADLNDESGGGGLLSLEELEQELAHLEDRTPVSSRILPTVPEMPHTAASMVVRAQEQNQSLNVASPGTSNAAPLDAWSLSLEKFTAASLQDDFLLADSARKAKTAAPPSGSISHQSPLFQDAEDYDVSEPLLFSAPPGLSSTSNSVSDSLVQQLTTRLETVAVVDAVSRSSSMDPTSPEPQTRPTVPPPPRAIPKTPQNSMTFILPKPPPMTPQNSITILPVGSGGPPGIATAEATIPVIQEHKRMEAPMPPTPPNSVHSQRHVVAGTMQQPPPPHLTPQIPMGPPVPEGMPSPPFQQQQGPRAIILSNPNPGAPTIPASDLASKFMSARDITYVVHSILKPILNHQQMNPPSPFDYDRAFSRKAAGVALAGPLASERSLPANTKKILQTMEDEMESRDKKAQSWSVEHHVLGRTAKSHVARPRALIAQPTKKDSGDTENNNSNSEQRQRQALWKSRIYCDQAYQAYLNVVETWHTAMETGGSSRAKTPEIAALLQPHLFKLLKCLGMARTEQQPLSEPQQQILQHCYSVVNNAALPLLMKLPKGRVLVARVLEQALLPPAAVSALLPSLLQAMYEVPLPTQSPMDAEAATISAYAQYVDDRLFAVVARVLQTLPDLLGTEILGCLDVVQEYSEMALLSPVRMQAVHALLQRGTQISQSDGNFTQPWKTREEVFLKILSG